MNPDDKHFDMAMCEYHYKGFGASNDVECYDRYWDGHEFYKDDTYEDSAYKMTSATQFHDNLLSLDIALAKNYKSSLGSNDYEI